MAKNVRNASSFACYLCNLEAGARTMGTNEYSAIKIPDLAGKLLYRNFGQNQISAMSDNELAPYKLFAAQRETISLCFSYSGTKRKILIFINFSQSLEVMAKQVVYDYKIV